MRRTEKWNPKVNQFSVCVIIVGHNFQFENGVLYTQQQKTFLAAHQARARLVLRLLFVPASVCVCVCPQLLRTVSYGHSVTVPL